jgi:acetyl-CoA synthetase
MLLERYLDRLEYSSYQDFRDHFRIRVPDSFNFAYDVVDEYARLDPGRIALVWCDEQGASATFTFAQLKEASDRTANLLRSLGIGRGDPVMLILKRRYEYWFCLLALHKLGAVAIPATHQLTPKDLVYRNNAASVKLIVATADPLVLEHV